MILGDCLEVMPTLPVSNFHMAFCDLPYGVTQHRWDKTLDLPALWASLSATTQSTAPIIMSATQPFASHLVMSNPKQFRYDIIWVKTSVTGFLQAKIRPLRCHENLLIFCRSRGTYNPQYTDGHKPWQRGRRSAVAGTCYGHKDKPRPPEKNDGRRHPVSVLSALSHSPRGVGRGKRWHPAQKPVALVDWLIRTYSSTGDHVLDPVSGSATTAVAALAAGRNVTCIEKCKDYFSAGVERVKRSAREGKIRAEIQVVT